MHCIFPGQGNAINLTDCGMLGDYIGGFWGTVISTIALAILFWTWRATRQANIRSGLMAVLVEMLKTHDEITSSNIGFSRIFLKEFATIYKLTKSLVPDDATWSTRVRIDLAYTYMFYGLSTQSIDTLKRYGEQDVWRLHNAIGRLQTKSGGKFANLFKGRQAELSHYMRNLFNMFVVVDEANLKVDEKKQISKIIRTKLSNYDQALLAMNILSSFGGDWEIRRLIERYKPISNIPKGFFGYDEKISLKKFFPLIEFEWERCGGFQRKYYTMGVWRIFVTFSFLRKF